MSIYMVFGLKMKKRLKFTVIGLFGARILVIPLIIMRQYYISISLKPKDESVTSFTLLLAYVSVFTELEIGYGIIAAAVPTLKPFLIAYRGVRLATITSPRTDDYKLSDLNRRASLTFAGSTKVQHTWPASPMSGDIRYDYFAEIRRGSVPPREPALVEEDEVQIVDGAPDEEHGSTAQPLSPWVSEQNSRHGSSSESGATGDTTDAQADRIKINRLSVPRVGLGLRRLVSKDGIDLSLNLTHSNHNPLKRVRTRDSSNTVRTTSTHLIPSNPSSPTRPNSMVIHKQVEFRLDEHRTTEPMYPVPCVLAGAYPGEMENEMAFMMNGTSGLVAPIINSFTWDPKTVPGVVSDAGR